MLSIPTMGSPEFVDGAPAPFDTLWYIKGEVLYWHAKSGGTDYAIALDSAIFPWSGTMKDCDFEWDLGFRVGVGRFIGSERKWDLTLDYTQCHTHDTESTNESNDSVVVIDSILGNMKGLSHAKFDGCIDYDALDLMLGKSFFISSKVSVYPKIGGKAAWLDQRYKFHGIDKVNARETSLLVAGKVFNTMHSNCDFFALK